MESSFQILDNQNSQGDDQMADPDVVAAFMQERIGKRCQDTSMEWTDRLSALAAVESAIWIYSCQEKRNLWANHATIAYSGREELEFLDSSLFDVDPAEEAGKRFARLNSHVRALVEEQGQSLQHTIGTKSMLVPGWPGSSPQITIQPQKLIYKPFKVKLENAETTVVLVQAELDACSLPDEGTSHLAVMSQWNPVHTFLFREDGSLIFANPAAQEYYKDQPNITLQQLLKFGIRRGEGETWEEVYNQAMASVFRDMKPTRVQQQQQSLKNPKKVKWMELELRPMADPASTQPAALVSVQNISQTKEVEDVLKKERNRLRIEKELLERDLMASIEDKQPEFDQASPLHNTFEMIDRIIERKCPSTSQLRGLRNQLLKSNNLWGPNLLREQFLKKGAFESDVGQNLLELLGDAQEEKTSEQEVKSRVWESKQKNPTVFSQKVVQRGLMRETFIPSSIIPSVEQVLMKSDNWTWDAFELDNLTEGCPCSTLGFWIFKHSGLLEDFELDEVKLSRFLRRIEEGYPANPYHNRIHACDVLQSIHVIIARGGLFKKQTDMISKLAAYIAAIIHDFEHGGLNNDFLIKSSDMLALRYNDRSPLENHHLAAAFEVLRHPECFFLNKMTSVQVSNLRHLCIDMVLATDMKQHFSILSQFQAKLSQHTEGSSKYPLQDAEASAMDEVQLSLTLQIGLKCSDVGHLACTREIHKKWVALLEEEFFRQGDQERMKSMSISPLMDRNKPGITKAQVGFFDIVALPLFRAFSSVYADCMPLLASVEDNFLMWKEIESSDGSS